MLAPEVLRDFQLYWPFNKERSLFLRMQKPRGEKEGKWK
jgi:hypothetical protein